MSGEVEEAEGHFGGNEQDWIGLSRTRSIVVELAHQSETMEAGREELGQVVRTCRGSGRAVHGALVRYAEGTRSETTSA